MQSYFVSIQYKNYLKQNDSLLTFGYYYSCIIDFSWIITICAIVYNMLWFIRVAFLQNATIEYSCVCVCVCVRVSVCVLAR